MGNLTKRNNNYLKEITDNPDFKETVSIIGGMTLLGGLIGGLFKAIGIGASIGGILGGSTSLYRNIKKRKKYWINLIFIFYKIKYL